MRTYRLAWIGLIATLAFGAPARAGDATLVPPPTLDDARAPGGAAPQTVVLAGGCFWGVQAVFQHVKGVSQALSGYAGGSRDTAQYEAVSTGRTGHAESVAVTFDPAVVSFGTILRVFFSVAHNPTEKDRQGPDVGPQYRSAIFVKDAEQRRIAERYVAQLDKAGTFRRPIVTEINDLHGFYPAEAYHQDYVTTHPNNPYIAYNDLPKLASLKQLFPELYDLDPVLVARR